MNAKFYTVFFRTASLISFQRIVVAQVPLEFHNEVIHASDYRRLFRGLMLCVVLSRSICNREGSSYYKKHQTNY